MEFRTCKPTLFIIYCIVFSLNRDNVQGTDREYPNPTHDSFIGLKFLNHCNAVSQTRSTGHRIYDSVDYNTNLTCQSHEDTMLIVTEKTR
jgi:hypothetical protein